MQARHGPTTDREPLRSCGPSDRWEQPLQAKTNKTGYSSGSLLTSSSRLISSSLSRRSAAARLSSSWLSRLAPMSTEVTTGLDSYQARAMRAGLQPCALAIGRIASNSLSTIGKSNSERRDSCGRLPLAAEPAGQETAGERTPHQQAQLLRLKERHQLALEVTPGDRVIGLQRVEAREIQASRYPERRRDPPCLPVRAARDGDCNAVR